MFIPYAHYALQAISGRARTFRAQLEEPHRIDASSQALRVFGIYRLVQALAISGSARTFRAQVEEPHRIDASSPALLHYVRILFPLLH